MFWWWFMPTVHFPLSGAVTQDIEATLLRQARVPEVERDVLASVASYGMQLGKLNEAVLALARQTGQAGQPEIEAIAQVQRGVDRAKRRRGVGPLSAAQLARDLDELRQRAGSDWEALIREQTRRLPQSTSLPAALPAP